MQRILTIIDGRPQFIKASVVSRAIQQTEWGELIKAGANELVGADITKIIEAATRNIGRKIQDTHNLYGSGKAAQQIVDVLRKANI
ncbi:UDP-N-acetylglucosamine 2-epimerase [Vibrio cholerae]